MKKMSVSKFRRSEDGATAVEFALVAPVFLTMLFGIVHIGIYFFGVLRAQQTTDETARQVRLLDRPGQDEIYELLKAKSGTALAGAYTPTVSIVQQYGGDYAEIEILYTYALPIPFLDGLQFSTDVSSKVLLRDLPT